MSLFWTPDDAATIVEMPLEIITTGTVDKGNGIYLLKAGTPLDEYFAVSNDEDAVYLVAEDFYFYSNTPTQPKIVPLITAGYVDLNKAEAASGLTYTDDCIAALEEAGITLVDGQLATGGGSSGGGALVVNATAQGTKLVCDKTAAEMYAAFPAIILYEVSNNEAHLITSMSKSGDDYWFAYFNTYGQLVLLEASSGDAYPIS